MLISILLALALIMISNGFNCGCTGSDDYDDTEKKPVIYLYPEEDDTSIKVSLDYDGTFTTVYPEFNSESDYTWEFVADHDGTITIDGKDYGYLFWEGGHESEYTIDSGYCVARDDLVPFLEEKLETLGLTDKEMDDFITFWLPELSKDEYAVISFDNSQYLEISGLNIDPMPDTLIRVFMTYTSSDVPVEIKEPEGTIVTPAREGFTVVEWGGCEID